MENTNDLAKAFVALQADLTPVAKSAVNPFFKSKFAPLPEVMENLQPLLAKHKLSVLQPLDNIDGHPAITTIVLHESGQMIQATSPLFLSKDDSQGHGSAITYARRYGLMSIFGLVADEDDDGNQASTPNAVSSHPATQKQLDYVKTLAEKKGFSDKVIQTKLNAIKTSDEASKAIENLQALEDEAQDFANDADEANKYGL